VGEYRRYHPLLPGKPAAGRLSRQGSGAALRGPPTSSAEQAQLRRTPFSRTSRNAASRHLGEVLSTAPHPPKPGHIGQTLNAREFSYSTCCTLQPPVARQFRGGGIGIESTADKALDTNTVGFSFLLVLQEKKRADERTRTADLLITSEKLGGAKHCSGLLWLAQSSYLSRFPFPDLHTIAKHCALGDVEVM
jgi:hypothetical protein